MAAGSRIVDIPLDSITIPRGRQTRDDKVEQLKESISKEGLLQPIMVRKHRDTNMLVFGRHRIAAAKALGWKTIPGIITDMNEIECQLAEIDENLIRANLNMAQESLAMAKRKELYLKLYPETAKGVAGGLASGKKRAAKAEATDAKGTTPLNGVVQPSFVVDTSEKTGKAQSTIFERVSTGESLSTKAADILDDHPVADSSKQLAVLAELPKQDQVAVAKQIASGEADSVKEALASRAKVDLESFSTPMLLAMNTDKIKPTKDQVAQLAKMPEARQNAVVRSVEAGKSLAEAIKTKPEKSGAAKQDVRLWSEIEGMIGRAINRTDELKRQFPNPVMHKKVLADLKSAMVAIKAWQKMTK